MGYKLTRFTYMKGTLGASNKWIYWSHSAMKANWHFTKVKKDTSENYCLTPDIRKNKCTDIIFVICYVCSNTFRSEKYTLKYDDLRSRRALKCTFTCEVSGFKQHCNIRTLTWCFRIKFNESSLSGSKFVTCWRTDWEAWQGKHTCSCNYSFRTHKH